jgi:hypothetical protein
LISAASGKKPRRETDKAGKCLAVYDGSIVIRFAEFFLPTLFAEYTQFLLKNHLLPGVIQGCENPDTTGQIGNNVRRLAKWIPV